MLLFYVFVFLLGIRSRSFQVSKSCKFFKRKYLSIFPVKKVFLLFYFYVGFSKFYVNFTHQSVRSKNQRQGRSSVRKMSKVSNAHFKVCLATELPSRGKRGFRTDWRCYGTEIDGSFCVRLLFEFYPVSFAQERILTSCKPRRLVLPLTSVAFYPTSVSHV